MSNNKKQKNIPKGWQEKKLGDIGVFSKGVGIAKNELSSSGNNAVRYGELYTKHDFVIKEIYSFIPNEAVSKLKKIKFGDILFTGSGETIEDIGKSATYLLKEDCYAGGDIIIFSAKKENSLFLSYLLNVGYARKELNRLGQGQSVVHVYKSSLEKMNIILPPLPEQKQIVKILETWDKCLEKLSRKIEVKKNIKKGLMQRLLTGEVRLSGFSGEWESVKLGDVVDFKNGKAHEKNITEGGEYIVVNSKFISSNGLVVKYSDKNLSPLSKDNIVMVMSDVPNGKAIAKCFLINKNDKYTLNQRICLMESKKDDSKFLFFILNRNKYFLQFDDGVKQTNLRKDDILDCPIKLPSKEEQTAIAKILTTADKEIEALEKKKKIVEEQKKYLLNNLVTGKIRTVKNIKKDKDN